MRIKHVKYENIVYECIKRYTMMCAEYARYIETMSKIYYNRRIFRELTDKTFLFIRMYFCQLKLIHYFIIYSSTLRSVTYCNIYKFISVFWVPSPPEYSIYLLKFHRFVLCFLTEISLRNWTFRPEENSFAVMFSARFYLYNFEISKSIRLLESSKNLNREDWNSVVISFPLNVQNNEFVNI